MTSVPAADVEGAVFDYLQKLLAAPELVARTWGAAKREGQDAITEREESRLLKARGWPGMTIGDRSDVAIDRLPGWGKILNDQVLR